MDKSIKSIHRRLWNLALNFENDTHGKMMIRLLNTIYADCRNCMVENNHTAIWIMECIMVYFVPEKKIIADWDHPKQVEKWIPNMWKEDPFL